VLTITIGRTIGHNGYEAANLAASQALRMAGKAPPALAWIIAAGGDRIEQVVQGATAALGDTPLIGFSTSAGLTAEGLLRRGVLVGLISGQGLAAKAEWLAELSTDSFATARQMLAPLKPPKSSSGALFLISDGFNGDSEELCTSLTSEDSLVAGCLAWGDLASGRSYQIGGKNGGANGLAVALLTGKFKIGVGIGLGWQPVGAIVRVTRAKGQWVRSLDGHHAAEVYARLFGYPVREWSFPPLSQLVRLYPLGFDIEDNGEDESLPKRVRSPLLVEADGSLRMNTSIPGKNPAYILVSSVDNCMVAAKKAAQQALENLGTARPALALIFADAAWQTLLEAHPGSEIQAVRAVLGAEVPIIGGYTYGQIYQAKTGAPVELLNQHIQVILLGNTG